MVTFAVETKMHYPVMTEQQVAARWKVSLKHFADNPLRSALHTMPTP